MAARQGRKPAVVEGLACADAAVMAWADGERERWWARVAALDHGREQADWVSAATGADSLSNLSLAQSSWLIAKGPEASARALLADPGLLRHRQRIDVGRVAVARFEVDALALALSEAGESADRLGLLLLPFRGPEAALLISGWLRHLGSARLWARLWLARHPEAAARALIPVAVGRPGRARQNAEDALLHLAAQGHRPIIRKAADEYGMAALAAITAQLEPAAPTARGATRKGKLPEQLPELRLTDGAPMPEDDVARLVNALTHTRLADPPEPPPGDPDPDSNSNRDRDVNGGRNRGRGGMPLAVDSSAAAQPLVQTPDPVAAELMARCDRQSLAEFGRVLLDEWLTEGMPAAGAWALLAQAHLGEESTMDALAPLVRSWPGRSRYARAIDGFAVLATAGTDTALRHLLAIEEGMSGGATNERALVYLAQAAARRGLSITQLADRLTITHGLDAGLTLDYGPRAFTVATDDDLSPYVVSPDGRRLARPPKPGARDTRHEPYQEFLRLKKDLRVTAAAQVARLERDMLARRLRPARDLVDVLLPHPILGPIARRLVWIAPGDEKGALRIAEDGSFADVHDATVSVDSDTLLGIAHPADLGADLDGWSQIIGDYEIVQPFPQVHRAAVRLTEAERASTSLAGFGPVDVDRLAGERWRGNEVTTTARLRTQVTHPLPGELTLVAEVAPGVATAGYHAAPEQRIAEIWVDDAWSDHWQAARRIPFGVCDAAALSELLTELYALREPAVRHR